MHVGKVGRIMLAGKVGRKMLAGKVGRIMLTGKQGRIMLEGKQGRINARRETRQIKCLHGNKAEQMLAGKQGRINACRESRQNNCESAPFWSLTTLPVVWGAFVPPGQVVLSSACTHASKASEVLPKGRLFASAPDDA
jgi:hypothetical protein